MDLASNSQIFALNITHDCEPSCYREATLDPAWHATMAQEYYMLVLGGFIKSNIRLMQLWKADATVERYKIRLVVKGYTQHHRKESIKNFSLIIKITTVRTLIATATKK